MRPQKNKWFCFLQNLSNMLFQRTTRESVWSRQSWRSSPAQVRPPRAHLDRSCSLGSDQRCLKVGLRTSPALSARASRRSSSSPVVLLMAFRFCKLDIFLCLRLIVFVFTCLYETQGLCHISCWKHVRVQKCLHATLHMVGVIVHTLSRHWKGMNTWTRHQQPGLSMGHIYLPHPIAIYVCPIPWDSHCVIIILYGMQFN